MSDYAPGVRDSHGTEFVTLPVLVGGPRAGKVIPIPKDAVEIQVPNALRAFAFDGPSELPPPAVTYDVERYRRYHLTVGTHETVIEAMVHSSLQGTAATRAIWREIVAKLKASEWTTTA